LKYFQEQAPEYHIIVAGSLLGVAVNRENFSFPVGKVDIKTLYPMDIEEFLLAMGEDKLIEQIKISFNENSPLSTILHDLAMEYYRKYLLIGGMPECVAKFKETENYTLIRHTQEMILLSYLNDMSKYNTSNEIKKTRLVYDNITVQLSRQNTRFQYKLVKTGGRASEFENAIEWLNLSGIISKIYCVQDIKKPLENYRNIDAFKIYISDLFVTDNTIFGLYSIILGSSLYMLNQENHGGLDLARILYIIINMITTCTLLQATKN